VTTKIDHFTAASTHYVSRVKLKMRVPHISRGADDTLKCINVGQSGPIISSCSKLDPQKSAVSAVENVKAAAVVTWDLF